MLNKISNKTRKGRTYEYMPEKHVIFVFFFFVLPFVVSFTG